MKTRAIHGFINKNLSQLSIAIILVACSACGGGSGSEKQSINLNNSIPAVSAGEDQSAAEGITVILTGSATDSDGEIVSYEWEQTLGQTVNLSSNANLQTSFITPTLINDAFEIFEFKITVSDDDGATSSDFISITVQSSRTSPPTGSCNVTISPGNSFEEVFANMNAGEILCLNDGKYQQAMDIPSNIHVRALNDGQAEIDGDSRLGEAWTGGLLQMHGSNSSARGIKVHHAGENSDACHVSGLNNSMQVMSCSHGGRHKHKLPLKIDGSGHLIENSWFYGEGRYVVQCFTGNNIILRGNVMRWDQTIADEPDEPNAAMSNYSCVDMIWENNISIDYGEPVTFMLHCGDICMSTTNNTPNSNVQYLGNIVFNHNLNTGNNKAFRADQKASTPSSNIRIQDIYIRSVDAGIVVNPIYDNITVGNCTMINVNNNSLVDGKEVECNGDADIQNRYVDGVKTGEPLWPWPNEALIKADLCANGERQSDWCTTTLSLRDYIQN